MQKQKNKLLKHFRKVTFKKVLTTFLSVITAFQSAIGFSVPAILTAWSISPFLNPLSASAQALPNQAQTPPQIVALLVEDSITQNSENLNGLSATYPNDLKPSTLRGRISRYSQDIQNQNPNTKVVMFKVKKDQPPAQIAANLEHLYIYGQVETPSGAQLQPLATPLLIGVITIGDVPLPVVKKDNESFVSMLPYTDFVDKAFIYDPRAKQFNFNLNNAFLQPEIWHGVINLSMEKSDYLNKLAIFFDKNHLYKKGVAEFADFAPRVFNADLFHESEALNQVLNDSYKRFTNNFEKIAYLSFDKRLISELFKEVSSDFSDSNSTNVSSETTQKALANDPFAALPDIQAKKMFDNFARPYISTIEKFVSQSAEFTDFTGRYRVNYREGNSDEILSDMDSIPSLIAQKDLLTIGILREINDKLEASIDSIARDLAVEIPLLSEVALQGRAFLTNGSIVNLNPVEFVNHGVNFVHGLHMSQLQNAEACSLFRGGGADGKSVMLNKVSNYSSAGSEGDNAKYAGCFGNNSQNPERCFSDLATESVFDRAGGKVMPNVRSEFLDYRACFDFKEKNQFFIFRADAENYLNRLRAESDPDRKKAIAMPVSKYPDTRSVVLYSNNNFAVTLADIAKAMNIPTDDWVALSSRLLGNPVYLSGQPITIQAQGQNGISRLELVLTPRNAKNISSVFTHKEPTNQTISAQVKADGLSSDLPIDSPRKVNFLDKGRRSPSNSNLFSTIPQKRELIYPNSFKSADFDELLQKARILENEIALIPNGDKYLNQISSIVQSYEKELKDAFAWRDKNLDSKHQYILREFTTKPGNAYMGGIKPQNGYEVFYMVSNGNSKQIDFSFNPQKKSTENDAEFIDPLKFFQQKSAQPQTNNAASPSGTGLNPNDFLPKIQFQMPDSVPIISWLPEIIVWIDGLSKLTNNVGVKMVCDAGSFIAAQSSGAYSDSSGVGTVGSQSSDQSAITSSLQNAQALRISSDKAVLAANLRDSSEIKLQILDSSGRSLNNISGPQVKLEFSATDQKGNSIDFNEIAILEGENPVTLVNGQAQIILKAKDQSGTININSRVIDGNKPLSSPNLNLRLTKEHLRLTSFKDSESERENQISNLSEGASYQVRDRENKLLAVFDPQSQIVRTVDESVEILIQSATATLPTRQLVIGKENRQVHGVFFVNENFGKRARVVPSLTDFLSFDQADLQANIYVKDSVESDDEKAIVAESGVYLRHSGTNRSLLNIGLVRNDGQIFLQDGYGLRRSSAYEDSLVYEIYEIRTANAKFEVLMKTNFTSLNLLTNQDSLQKFLDSGKDISKKLNAPDESPRESIFSFVESAHAQSSNAAFPDLPPTHESYQAVSALRARGVIEGFTDGLFKPDQAITREEFTKVNLGAICVDCTGFSPNQRKKIGDEYLKNPFPDKDFNPELLFCVAESKNRGIISGYLSGENRGSYLPKSPISRAEAAKILLSAFETENSLNLISNSAPRADLPWYFQTIIAAQKENIFPKGRFKTLDELTNQDFETWFVSQYSLPESIFDKWLNQPISRGEFSIMAYNLLSKYDCSSKSSIQAKAQVIPATNADLSKKSQWEKIYNLELSDPNQAYGDGDSDGLTNYGEFLANTNPFLTDTDGGGINDGDEILLRLNPLDAGDDIINFNFDLGYFALGENLVKEFLLEDFAPEKNLDDIEVAEILDASDFSEELTLRAEIIGEDGQRKTDDSQSLVRFIALSDSVRYANFLRDESKKAIIDTVRVRNGLAEVKIRSKELSGEFNWTAQLINQDLPSEQKTIFIRELQAAQIKFESLQKTISTDGKLSGKVKILVTDKFGNQVKNEPVSLSIQAADGIKFSNQSQKSIKKTIFEGELILEVLLDDKDGDTSIKAVITNTKIESSFKFELIESLDLKLRVRDEGDGIYLLIAEVFDQAGVLQTQVQGEAVFKVENQQFGAVKNAGKAAMRQGRAEVEFVKGTKSGEANFTVSLAGFDSAGTSFAFEGGGAKSLRFIDLPSRLNSASSEKHKIQVELIDEFGNRALTSQKAIRLRATDSSEKLAEIKPIQALTNQGVVEFEISGKNSSGVLRLVASSDDLVSASGEIELIQEVKFADWFKNESNFLFASLLGGAFGQINDNSAINQMLFAGRTQAVSALTAVDEKKTIFELKGSGGMKIGEEFSLNFQNTSDDEVNLFSIVENSTGEAIAEIIQSLPVQNNLRLVEMGEMNAFGIGIYLASEDLNSDYKFIKNADSLSIQKSGAQLMAINQRGKIVINSGDLQLRTNPEKSGNDLVLEVFENDLLLGELIFINQESFSVEIIKEINQKATSTSNRFYLNPIAKEKFSFAEGFSGSSSNSPKSALIQVDKDITEQNLFATGYENPAFAKEKMGIGFTGDNKHIASFAAGNSVGEATKFQTAANLINFGDPTIRLTPKKVSKTGFTQDIGKKIITTQSPINETLVLDFNANGLNDLITVHENGDLRFLENIPSRGYVDKGVITNIPSGILSIASGDLNGDSFADLLIATKDPCKKNQPCLDAYLNQGTRLIRENLNLDFVDRVMSMQLADLKSPNGKGKFEDLVLIDSAGTVKVFWNKRDGKAQFDEKPDLLGNIGSRINSSANLKEEVLIIYEGIAKKPIKEATIDPDSEFVSLSVTIPESDSLPASIKQKLNLGSDPLAKIDFSNQPNVDFEKDARLAHVPFDFMYLDADNLLGVSSSKKARDTNGGSLLSGDQIEYEIEIRNNSANTISNLMIADVIAQSMEVDIADFKCELCSSDLQAFQTNDALRPYAFGFISISPRSSIKISYTATYNQFNNYELKLGNNFDPAYPRDEFLDILVKPNPNPTGRVIYFHSNGTDQSSNRIKYRQIASAKPQATSIASPFGDLNKQDSNTLSEKVRDDARRQNSEDKNKDGLVDTHDIFNGGKNFLDSAGDFLNAATKHVSGVINQITSAMRCGGSCIANPINISLLTPGTFSVLGVPVGVDPGLPIFAAGIPSPFPIWPPSPYQGSIFRFYLSPTTTLGLGTSICMGPYLVPGASWCFSAAFSPLSVLGVCDAINNAVSEALAGAVNFISSAGNLILVTGQSGSDTMQSVSSKSASGGVQASPALGGTAMKASSSVNIRVPSFPSVLTSWLERQGQEIVNKLTDLPDIYFFYPDFSTVFGYTELPPSEITNLDQILTYINSLPVLDITSRDFVLRFPMITEAEFQKTKIDFENWIHDAKNELNRVKGLWKCDSLSPQELRVCNLIFLRANELIRSVEENLRILNEYRQLPYRIRQWRNIEAKYVRQIICYLDAVIQFTGGYVNKQKTRIEQWKTTIDRITEQLKKWRVIIDLAVDYQKSCDTCTTDRLTLTELMMKIFVVIPDLPVIPFPKWPDIVIDVSEIRLGLNIVWPQVRFEPSRVVIPTLPRLRLPLSLPRIEAEIPALPVIPALPDLPQLPDLPNLPPLPIPTLPDLPPPPNIPDIPDAVFNISMVLKDILQIFCLVKVGLMPIPEMNLKTHIETLTARSLSPLLPIDTFGAFQLPQITYETVDRIEIKTRVNLQLESDHIYDSANDIAKVWNSMVFDLTENLNFFSNTITQSAQEAADSAASAAGSVQEGINQGARELNETLRGSFVPSSRNLASIKAQDSLLALQKAAIALEEISAYQLQLNSQMPAEIRITAFNSWHDRSDAQAIAHLNQIKSRASSPSDNSNLAATSELVRARDRLIAFHDEVLIDQLKVDFESIDDQKRQIAQLNNQSSFKMISTVQSEMRENMKKSFIAKNANSELDSLGKNIKESGNALAQTQIFREQIDFCPLEKKLDFPDKAKIAVTNQNSALRHLTASTKALARKDESKAPKKQIAQAGNQNQKPDLGGSHSPQVIDRGIFIYNSASGVNEKLIRNLSDLDSKSTVKFVDFDKDSDEDVILTFGGDLYVKENYRASSAKTYVREIPLVFANLNSLHSYPTQINGFSTVLNSARSVDLTWGKASYPVKGYEIAIDGDQKMGVHLLSDASFNSSLISKVPSRFQINGSAAFKVNGQETNNREFDVNSKVESTGNLTLNFDDSSVIKLGNDSFFEVSDINERVIRLGGEVEISESGGKSFFLQKGMIINVESGQAILKFQNGRETTLSTGSHFINEVINSPRKLSQLSGKIQVMTGSRVQMSPASATLEIQSTNQIHALKDSIFILKSEQSSARHTLKQGEIMLAGLVDGLEPLIIMESGEIEIIDPKAEKKLIDAYPQMSLELGDKIFVANGYYADLNYGGGSDLRIDRDTLLDELLDFENPSYNLKIENGNYQARIRAINGGSGGVFSPKITLSPSICADKIPPIISGVSDKMQVSIYKSLIVDLSKSSDDSGEIASYYLDNDLDFDSDGDLDPANDAVIFGRKENPSLINIGPFLSPETKKIKAFVEDEAGNIAAAEIEIEVIVPDVEILEVSKEKNIVKGQISIDEDQIPIALIRERNGQIKLIKTPSANTQSKYFTNNSGEFQINDLNTEKIIDVRNSKGELIAEINSLTGQVRLVDNSMSIEVLPAFHPFLPTRIVIYTADKKIAATIVLVADAMVDVKLHSDDFAFESSNLLELRGVHLKSLTADKRFSYRPIRDLNNSNSGSIEIFDGDKRISLVDTGGNIYLFDDKAKLKLSGNDFDKPLIIDLIYEDQKITSIYISPQKTEAKIIAEQFFMPQENQKLIKSADTDGDGIADSWELKYGLDPNNPRDALLDFDNDGLTNLQEFIFGTDPRKTDTDGDGFSDFEEITFGKDPKSTQNNFFADVSVNSPSFNSIKNLFQKDIIRGYTQNGRSVFLPENEISRAEFTEITLKTLCVVPRRDAYLAPQIFSDIPFKQNLDWFYPTTKEAYLQGLISGYLAEQDQLGRHPFKPQNQITRAEAVKIILEALNTFEIIDLPNMTAAAGKPWYENYIFVAQNLAPYKKSTIGGNFLLTNDEALKANELITRIDFVVMAERVLGVFNCFELDADGDGMPDWWEKKHGLNPNDPSDANSDPDNDGLTNIEEYRYGTNPRDPDTDKGGVKDGDEIKRGTNPLDPRDDFANGQESLDPVGDFDGDGLSNIDEIEKHKTDPRNPDTDGDGLTDGAEVLVYKTDPLNPDTDKGGIKDGIEVKRGTDSLDPSDDFTDNRRGLNPGIYALHPECLTCPCEFSLDYRADLVSGDLLKAVISNMANTQIFASSRDFTVK